jgi:hypothetical protein
MERQTTQSTLASHPGAFRVLHVSDIHVGRGFQKSRWDNLLDTVRTKQVDLVVLTGDLVNTPWRWQRTEVLRRMDQLAKAAAERPAAPPKQVTPAPPQADNASSEAAATNPRCKLHVITGNHDTRLLGIVPVAWFTAGASLLFLVAGGASLYGVLGESTPNSWRLPVLVIWVLATLLGVLRACMVPNMAAQMKGYFLQGPWVSDCGRVGMVPLDSSSYPSIWANGHLRAGQFSKLGTAMDECCAAVSGTPNDPMWIALVHHHLLPLPYDSKHERLMILDNAGSVLQELTDKRIRLVLHGHKHHQNFMRVVMGATKGTMSELAVLSAGTPSFGRSGMEREHGFYLIDVYHDQHATVFPFWAPAENGSFKEGESFDVVPPHVHARERFMREQATLPLFCERLLCVVHINDFGDATLVREFQGVTARLERVAQLSDPLIAAVEAGVVEAFVASNTSKHGPEIRTQLNEKSPGRTEARIEFVGGVAARQPAFDFTTRFFASNAVALNKWHLKCMYDQNREEEELRWRVPDDVSIEELVLYVSFPPDSTLPIRTRVRCRVHDNDEWTKGSATLLRVETQNVLQARISYPVPGAIYAITWGVTDPARTPDSPRRAQAIGLAKLLRKKLAEAVQSNALLHFAPLLEQWETIARVDLGDPNQQNRPFDISVYCYDEVERNLKYLLGTHPLEDSRRRARYGFGRHPIGRCFKISHYSPWMRPNESPAEYGWGYVLPNGGKVVDEHDVPEYAMIAFPMSPVDAPDWPYAVLVISTDDPGHQLKTSDRAGDAAMQRFDEALKRCTLDVERIFAVAH